MTAKSINSAIHFAAWFVQKAAGSSKKLSHVKLQNMLFLAQLHQGISNGEILMPSMFVCCDKGFYEPNVRLALKQGLALEMGSFIKDELDLLESVWDKYEHLSEEELLNQVCNLSLWKNSYQVNKDVIVNPLEYTAHIDRDDKPKKSENKAKIRLSQNGPVKVSPWRPRKINDNNKVD